LNGERNLHSPAEGEEVRRKIEDKKKEAGLKCRTSDKDGDKELLLER